MQRLNIKKVIRLWLLLIAISSLQGCVNAAVTSAQVVYDRHNLKKSLDDHYITMQSYQKIYNNTPRYKDTAVSATTLNRVVLLTGQVQQPEQRIEIEKLIKEIPNVKEVYNLTYVGQTPSALTQMSDTWITTKIKSQLIASEEVDPSQVKVVTENGIVYLMGIIPPSQAKEAVYIARTTEGVQSVVKIFSYLRVSKN